MLKSHKLPSFSNVVGGATATVDCPVGLTYHKMVLKMGGDLTPAKLKNIEVVIDGKTVQKFADGTRVDTINKYWGRGEVKSNTLTLWFERPELTDEKERFLPCLGTANVSTLSLQADIDSTCANPTLEAWAVLGAPSNLGVFTKVKNFPTSFATAGVVDIDNIPRMDRIAAVHLFKDDISSIEVEVDGIKAVDMPKVVGAIMQEQNGRSPQSAKATHIDFLESGLLNHSLMTGGVQDFRIKPKLETSGAVDIVVEYLGNSGGI